MKWAIKRALRWRANQDSKMLAKIFIFKILSSKCINKAIDLEKIIITWDQKIVHMIHIKIRCIYSNPLINNIVERKVNILNSKNSKTNFKIKNIWTIYLILVILSINLLIVTLIKIVASNWAEEIVKKIIATTIPLTKKKSEIFKIYV